MVQTYVAAEKLEQAGKKLGVDLSVETQGAMGIQNQFSPEQIDEADYIVIAADVAIDEASRFGNKKLYVTSLEDAIVHPDSFIFPFLMKGKSRMPLAIMLMGVVFNVLNGLMQGEWLFYLAPEGLYTDAWLSTPSFWLGVILFFIGMGINLHSDSVIRHLRKPGDTRHYLPQKGMYRYVTSGNYFGELVEWIGFAVLTCSPAAWVFVLWTFANLAPRANSIRNRYREEFGKDAVGKKKRMIPFIY